MNRFNGSQSGPEDSAASNVGRLLHRLVELVELQGELLKVDVREGVRSLSMPVALILTGVVVGFGGVFVLLLALAGFLTWLGIPQAVALLVAAVVGLAAAGGAGWLGWQFLRKALIAFDRSRAELRANIAWLKSTLRHTSSEDRVHAASQMQK